MDINSNEVNMKQPLIVPVVLNCNDEYWLPYCLEATRGFFSRYVVYDIGSSDASKSIINWFLESTENVEFYYRSFTDIIQPTIQGIFRNSMIAEARSEWYFILDADEIYSPSSLDAILQAAADLQDNIRSGSLYGVVPRVEIASDLQHAYALDRETPHHRLYHRTAIWTGSHPGEVPFYVQRNKNELWFPDITCFHFHNAERSTKDGKVPKRQERKARGTYRPGDPEPFDLFTELPILKKPIAEFEPAPTLKALQNDQV
jgi:hypothetical protein